MRQGAALEEVEAFGTGLRPVPELVEQPALADAGIGDNDDDIQLGIAADFQERLLQTFELGIAPDHPRLDAFDAARRDSERAWLGALDQIGDDGRIDALDLDRRLRLDIEHAAHLAIGVVADAHTARRARSVPCGRRC